MMKFHILYDGQITASFAIRYERDKTFDFWKIEFKPYADLLTTQDDK